MTPDYTTPAIRPRRSALFLPASNARAVAKARGLDADVVILDLEDAVVPEAKAAAREAAVAAVRGGGWGNRELVVRVNGLDTEWAADDLSALSGIDADAVLLPKVSSPDTLAQARALLGEGPALWAMVETARGVLTLPAIADAGYGLAVLVAGTNDLAREMRCRPGSSRAPLVSALTGIVLAARAAGLGVLDGVCNAIGDGDLLDAECRQGRDLGFDGKTLIHPSQIAAANTAFAPDPEEVAWAQRVVDAFAQDDRGAIRLDGRMVERLHLEEARRTLALAGAVAR
ncbi:citrate lyase subunit beta / citryl-CoA lyase [Sphingomonas gellani]|uniref:Citrate lyase subunit beta / citryl-CoA lyase n=1 Tax=Sphingomonas gellani TaxID=1166340 RepID=A0A1H8GJK8_9SPHN|nr:CoA ester lyase [Sphingomonas gellani]SEN43934.1 citrate lyase subunit beta / citryl-CoA lyase [Sphingomonas gellani]